MKTAHDEVASQTAPTFESTFKRLALLEGQWEPLLNSCTFPGYVSESKEMRDASTECTKKLENLAIELTTREDVYRALRGVDLRGLDAVDARLAKKMLEDFERLGVALPEPQRGELKQIRQRISELCIQFQQHINEDQTSLAFTRDELRGLPESFLDGLARDGEKYRVTLKYPDLFPVLKSCEVASTRRAMDEAHGRQCNAENVPILEEVFALRHRAARLLGFASDAEFETSVLMAKSASRVSGFLESLRTKLAPFASRELAKLRELKAAVEGDGGGSEVLGHDFRFYHQQLLQREYSLDEEAIRQYFPLPKVLEGLLEIYGDMLGLGFREVGEGDADRRVWHADVRQFRVTEKDDGAREIGELYLDLHPRDGKYTHAAAFPLQGHAMHPGDDKWQKPICALVCNFSRPGEARPSLLDFNEVTTLFHEAGHGFHNLCSTARYSRFAGTSVERDFVEAPSQMLENWCYDRRAISKMSAHWQTGEPIPQAFIDALLKAKNVDVGLLTLRQIFFATFDQTVHSQERSDTQALWHRLRQEVTLIPQAPGTNPVATFGHLSGGYNSRYYGYLYSDVFASDMFATRFQKDIFEEKAGRDYRDVILAHGGSRDSLESLKEFLGREPNEEAFLKLNGLIN